MVKLILKNSLIFKALSLCLIARNILSVRSQEISDCAIVREAAKKLGTSKIKFVANNCCDLDVITCNAKNVIGIKLIGISCFDFSVKLDEAISKFATLKYLESFELSYQSWCNKPNNIPQFKNLKSLVMTHNDFKDTLPEYVIQLTKLEKLDLSFNRYYGTIPNSYRKLKNLKSLILNNNNISGNIPYSFIKLENLTELNLAENKELTGYIPELSKINTCDYANTNLCSIKNDTCTTNLGNTCTQDIITQTDKSNGKETFNNDIKQDELEATKNNNNNDVETNNNNDDVETNNNNDDVETNDNNEPDSGTHYFKYAIITVIIIIFSLIILFISYQLVHICRKKNVSYNSSYINNTSSRNYVQTTANINNNNNNIQTNNSTDATANDQIITNNNSNNNNNRVNVTIRITDNSNNNNNNNREEGEEEEEEGRLLIHNNGSNEKPHDTISDVNNNQPSSSNNNTSKPTMTTNPTYASIPIVDPNSTSAANLPYTAYPIPVQAYPLPNQSYPPPPQGYLSYPQYYQKDNSSNQPYPAMIVQGYSTAQASKVNNPQDNSQNVLPANRDNNGNSTAISGKGNDK